MSQEAIFNPVPLGNEVKKHTPEDEERIKEFTERIVSQYGKVIIGSLVELMLRQKNQQV